jgi:hypothetical protein
MIQLYLLLTVVLVLTYKVCFSEEYDPIPTMRARHEFGGFLETQKNLKVGAEIGVQQGEFSHMMLSKWSHCTDYYLVDVWKHQDNYEDSANIPDADQEVNYRTTKKRLHAYHHITRFVRMYSLEASELLSRNATDPVTKKVVPFLDFLYIDARHDYCGCLEDLIAWYPLLKSGGIFAGDDYSPHYPPSWDKCGNGSTIPGSVYRAVNEFGKAHNLNIMATTTGWPNWIARKP